MVNLADHLDHASWPWEAKALKQLDDIPETRSIRLEEFKLKIATLLLDKNPEFKPLMEDNFLLSFLRTRKFKVDKAIDCFERFHQIRSCNPRLIVPWGKGPKDYPHVLDLPLVAMMKERNPLDGSLIIVWSFRNYNMNIGEISDMLNIALYGVLEALDHPSVQTYGVRFVFDLTGLKLAHTTMMLTRIYYLKAITKAQNGVPARFKGMHYINEPYNLAQIIYKVIRPMLSKKMRRRFHFHGGNLDELFTYVSPMVIPEDIGGTGSTFRESADWFREVLFESHEEIVRKSRFGFVNHQGTATASEVDNFQLNSDSST